jgi:hypothetical protein
VAKFVAAEALASAQASVSVQDAGLVTEGTEQQQADTIADAARATSTAQVQQEQPQQLAQGVFAAAESQQVAAVAAVPAEAASQGASAGALTPAPAVSQEGPAGALASAQAAAPELSDDARRQGASAFMLVAAASAARAVTGAVASALLLPAQLLQKVPVLPASPTDAPSGSLQEPQQQQLGGAAGSAAGGGSPAGAAFEDAMRAAAAAAAASSPVDQGQLAEVLQQVESLKGQLRASNSRLSSALQRVDASQVRGPPLTLLPPRTSQPPALCRLSAATPSPCTLRPLSVMGCASVLLHVHLLSWQLAQVPTPAQFLQQHPVQC